MKSLNDMIAYLDTETEHDTRYEVVSYLLAHLRELDAISLSRVARETYVSKSTVSRVVRRFGFESYDEFLSVARRLVHQDPSVTLRITPDEMEALQNDVGSYIGIYVDGLCAALQDLKCSVSDETIDWFINQVATNEAAGSFAVVLTNYGRYLEDHRDALEALKGRGVTLCLVTLCYDGPSCLLFDRVIRLSAHGYSGIGSFPLKAFFKIVIRRLLTSVAN